MKKNICLITCFSIFFICSMEKLDQKKTNHFSIILYGTTINVSIQSLSDITDTDLFIVGNNEQFLLDSSISKRWYTSGAIIRYQNHIFCKNKNDENDIYDDTYNFFEEENISKRQKNVIQHSTHNKKVIVIIEPCISLRGWCNDYLSQKQISIPQYMVQRRNKDQQLLPYTFHGDQAISEASKDLALCYKTILEHCTNPQTIAIPTLGADVGFPREKAIPIALTSILTFLNNNPYVYERIELVVKKQSEFTAYKRFLSEHWQQLYLFLLAHHDTKHFLYNIPRDIIDYILQLTHICMYY